LTNKSFLAHQLLILFPKMYVGTAMRHMKAEVPPNTYIIFVGPFAATQ